MSSRARSILVRWSIAILMACTGFSAIAQAQRATGLPEAVITARGKVGGHRVYGGAMDMNFIGGSMGSAVGEKITRLIEHAIKDRGAVIIFAASGGARMQEGTLSLMQMAKISAALAALEEPARFVRAVAEDAP